MKVEVAVEIKPFKTPNFVVEEKENEAATFPLSALDSMTLDRLCDQFRDEIFKKAGKEFPPVAAACCPKCGNDLG